jgi:hypothetical protein
MQDETIHADLAAEIDLTEHVVLHLLLDDPHAGPWAEREIALMVGDDLAATDAIAGLHSTGLVHRCHEFVFATYAATRGRDLARVS